MASPLAPPLCMQQAMPAQLADHLQGDPRAQLAITSRVIPELQAASRALQEVAEVSHEEAPPPPPPGSHNSELFPELDSQVVPHDMRENPPLQEGAQFTGFEFELPEEPEGYAWFPDASVGQGAYILLKSTTPRGCEQRKNTVAVGTRDSQDQTHCHGDRCF